MWQWPLTLFLLPTICLLHIQQFCVFLCSSSSLDTISFFLKYLEIICLHLSYFSKTHSGNSLIHCLPVKLLVGLVNLSSIQTNLAAIELGT